MTTPQTIPVAQATALIAAFFAGTKLHPRQVISLSQSILGAMYAERAGVAHFGRAMARVRGVKAKHAIKQLDRLLGNEKVPDEEIFRRLIRLRAVESLGMRRRPRLDRLRRREGHHRIALNLVTRHGRATPLVWKIVRAEDLKDRRNDHEDELLRLFKRLMPSSLGHVTLLADRGFGDIKLYDMAPRRAGLPLRDSLQGLHPRRVGR
jgi:hypothetical protein